MFAWHRSALAGAVLALAAVYLIALRTPAAGIFHDDGVYLVTAKALATGQGYRIASLPGEIFQTKYPPLFPLLLAAAWKLYPRFPDNVAVLKCAPLLCAVVWFW